MNKIHSKTDVYYGLDGIKAVFDDIVETKKELVGWGATDRARELLPEFTNTYIERREKNNVRARQLAVEGNGVLETTWSKFKFVPKEYSSPATTLVYGNKIALMMWFSDPIVSIRISDPKIAESYRNHFEFLWGTKLFSSQEILASQLTQKEIASVFQNRSIEVIERQSSWIIRLKKESTDVVQRIIILPPNGSTAGDYSGELENHDKFSPHPEVLEAKIKIKGGIAPGRLGYRKIDRAIKFSYFTNREVDVNDRKLLKESYKSSHTPIFKVIKPNGFGFWHNITNTSNEWVLLILEKKLVATTPLRVDKVLSRMNVEDREKVEMLIYRITKEGDHIFKQNTNPLIELSDVNQDLLTQALIALLNLPEHANHESCTVVALILKIARNNRRVVREMCVEALEKNSAPRFYLDEILNKLSV